MRTPAARAPHRAILSIPIPALAVARQYVRTPMPLEPVQGHPFSAFIRWAAALFLPPNYGG